MSLDDFVRHCCGDPDCPNDCEREPVPARRPEDDALDRLKGALSHAIYRDTAFIEGLDAHADLATVRDLLASQEQELERLREGMESGDRLLSQAGRQLEDAEAELQRLTGQIDRVSLESNKRLLVIGRLTEGLREIRRDCAQRWTMDKIDALLADSQDGGGAK